MKNILSFILLFTLLFLFISCSNQTPTPITEPNDNNTQTDPPDTKIGYADIVSLTKDNSITAVTQEDYSRLTSIDLSKLPESVADMYRGIINDTVTYQILYKVDSFTVSAYISAPKDYLTQNYPLVIYNRGGNGNFSAVTAEQIATYTYPLNCVVIASNYRGTTPGTGKDEFGGADVKDVVFWMDIVEKLDFIDKNSVYMIGESRGGMQTCLALINDKNGVVKAAACISGAFDITNLYYARADMQEMLTKRIGGTPEQVPDEYKKRSAVTFADKIGTPLLIVHSKNDASVPFEQAKAFTDKLEEYNKKYKFTIRNDSYHGIVSPDELVSILEELKELAR